MKNKRKRNAIHSGIGDQQDLLVKAPEKEEQTQTFRYAARLRGKKRHHTMIYPEVPFQYGISYEGERLETYNEKPYELGLMAHPQKQLDFCIEQTKKLPIKRLWEAEACFEAEVERKKLKYALTYQGKTGIPDKREAEYAIKWKGQYTKQSLGDVKDLFTDANGHYIGYNEGSTGWEKSGSVVRDKRNRHFFSGVIAKDMYTWDAYEASFDFKPILNDGANQFGKTVRYNWQTKTFYAAPAYDDDLVGLIFSAQDKNNFYMMLWESEERVYLSGRSGDNLNGIDLRADGNAADHFVGRQATSAATNGRPTHAQWIDYCDNKGWGKGHYRIYKVVNGIMNKIDTKMLSDGRGWVMNQVHRVRVVTNKAHVQIFGRTSPTGAEFPMFNLYTAYLSGSVGICNVSQAVEFHNITLTQKESVEGRIPETGWDKTADASKVIASNATTYVKASQSFLDKVPNGSRTWATLTEITGELKDAANGSITVSGLTGSIKVTSNDFSSEKGHSGRIPATGWFEFDGVGEQTLAPNALEYIRQKSGQAALEVTNITPLVEDPSAGSLIVSSDSGPIIAKNNNAADAGQKYSECFTKCSVVEITPDNVDQATGVLVFADVQALFTSEHSGFFNRGDFINKKETYRLLAPVQQTRLRTILDRTSGGCVIEEEPAPPPPGEAPPSTDCDTDFFYDGKKLIMWSCEFPIEKETKCFDTKVIAYEGWKTLNPLGAFTPNNWTTYELLPEEASINPKYDTVKWANQVENKDAPVGSKVIARTTEWYEARWENQRKIGGIVTSLEELTVDVPLAPEFYYEPEAPLENPPIEQRMPSYDVIHYLLDSWNNSKDVTIWFASNPSITTSTLRLASTKVMEGRAGMPLMKTELPLDQLLIHCKEDPRFIPWTSGKYIGYGKVNGKRPYWGNGSGKADLIDVDTNVVYIPADIIRETLRGPFIDVYDDLAPNQARVIYRLSNDGKKVSFSSEHTDAYVWYSDWYSNWVEEAATFEATSEGSTKITDTLDLDPTLESVSTDYHADDTFIERMEVTGDNPFVNLWIQEDKGRQRGLLGTYYQLPITTKVWKEQFEVGGDYKEWIQAEVIAEKKELIRIPLDHSQVTILSVKVNNQEIPNHSINGWTQLGGQVVIKGTAIEEGPVSIRYATGSLVNRFILKYPVGKKKEVYVNGQLLDPIDYSISGTTLTIRMNQLSYNAWVNIQSYNTQQFFDTTKKNYLGERMYAQLDFQEDVPTNNKNPNFQDPYYEGAFAFNWGYDRPVGMQMSTMSDVQPPPVVEKPIIPEVNPPIQGSLNDGFAVSWNGYIYAPTTGMYTFKATVNDGFRLWIRGELIIDEWHEAAAPTFFPEYEKSIYLEGGKWHSIRANYLEHTGQALVRLHWAMPNKAFQRIAPDYLTPYLGYELLAQVKQAAPLPWSPMIHNGYYYQADQEHYLFAQKEEVLVTPNALKEIVIRPRPQQGSAILLETKDKQAFRKVTFYDSSWKLTLENTEEFYGTHQFRYALAYKEVDAKTIRVRLNEVDLTTEDYTYDATTNAIGFLRKLGPTDKIMFRYYLENSYYVDMNESMEEGIIQKDQARIKLHTNLPKEALTDMRLVYEAAQETPFYRANELVINPLLTHHHTGFLYLTKETDQWVKDLELVISHPTIAASQKEPVVITAKVTDAYQNPCPKKEVTITRDGVVLLDKALTNEAGEVYFYDHPMATATKKSIYQATCEEQTKEAVLHYYVNDQPDRYGLDVVVGKYAVLAKVNDTSTIQVTVRDKNWEAVGAGKTVHLRIRHSDNQVSTKTLTTNSLGQITYTISGLTEQHGNVSILFSYDMGFEQTSQLIHIKVIGG